MGGRFKPGSWPEWGGSVPRPRFRFDSFTHFWRVAHSSPGSGLSGQFRAWTPSPLRLVRTLLAPPPPDIRAPSRCWAATPEAVLLTGRHPARNLLNQCSLRMY